MYAFWDSLADFCGNQRCRTGTQRFILALSNVSDVKGADLLIGETIGLDNMMGRYKRSRASIQPGLKLAT